MDGKMLARLGAVAFVAVAITAAVVELTRKEEPKEDFSTRIIEPSHDPLRAGQRRCQQLGQQAASDAECLRVWAETRDRFLRPSSAPASPSSSEGR
ncbi:putative entry exclusion protein TrbK-alt [Reyranella sp.]|jgi:conjugative transfer region protein TrbK|uniref:putative entry exclusion protein TrbK-alt n=1 Tax=Reyranella sp. TaxID=1929291 RepID=UPI000BCE0AD4|nr:putative entry exclusion protein TrbK-alt [Reyranella sp.]OYY87923.1 MAG: conjugal transfer protein TrbK [Rhizobiales bacterium 35-66-30]OYZ82087.1 MAG: conjugal transfer protein TrbK [Rhizobiales bacterium 24-66-13]OZB11061.1 MAG: conjugal transfer protein TrbK [Rhizobiales bacterium 39-66-18]HQS47999.1 putative entry exclusion protein TrbK-alt [Xanthobacteraceae bacterium]